MALKRAGVQGTAGAKSSDSVHRVLVHILKVGAGVIGKNDVVERALEGNLDVLDRRDLWLHLCSISW